VHKKCSNLEWGLKPKLFYERQGKVLIEKVIQDFLHYQWSLPLPAPLISPVYMFKRGKDTKKILTLGAERAKAGPVCFCIK